MKLVELKLNRKIDIIVYENKYKDLSNELDKLRQEKVENANQELDQKSIKERIKEYKSNFNKNARMTVFDKEVFDILVKRVIVGTINEKGEKDPYSVVLIMNTDIARKYSYLDFSTENTKKNYIDITKGILAKNFRPSLIHNTI